jgi:predicted NBD/HSP70 family sugar kinase
MPSQTAPPCYTGRMYLGIDIGGTKTLLACFDEGGKIVAEQRFLTPDLYENFLEALKQSLAIMSEHRFLACGLAAPALIDHENGIAIKFGNLAWENAPLKRDVEEIIGVPVSIENDAKAATLSEARLFPEYEKAMYITISTGIGAGVAVNGHLDKTLEDIEPGHMMLEHEGIPKKWESFASGRAIAKKYGLKASEIDDPSAWEEISYNIAIGLIDIIALVRPDVILVGGGVGSHFEKFAEPLNEALRKMNNKMIAIPPILKARHPEEAVVYGCFELAKEAHADTSHQT